MSAPIETDEVIGRARVLGGDCVAVMRALAAAGARVQAVVTDPPYHLTEVTRRFGKPGSAPPKAGATSAYARAARGVEPGLFPLVDAGRFRNRVGLLRGSGNAVVAALAAAFIRTCDEWLRGAGE